MTNTAVRSTKPCHCADCYGYPSFPSALCHRTGHRYCLYNLTLWQIADVVLIFTNWHVTELTLTWDQLLVVIYCSLYVDKQPACCVVKAVKNKADLHTNPIPCHRGSHTVYGTHTPLYFLLSHVAAVDLRHSISCALFCNTRRKQTWRILMCITCFHSCQLGL